MQYHRTHLLLYYRGVMDLIVIGGAAPSYLSLDLSVYSRIIAADSGYDTARRLGLSPDAVVGDFDSTSLSAELLAAGYDPCPRDKDESDAELAIRLSEKYDLVGGGEGRIDHTFSLFTVFRCCRPPRVWYMASDTLVSLKGKCRFTAPLGTAVSMIPLYASKIDSSGLKWELGGREINERFLSLSNRTVSEEVEITSSDTVFLRFDPAEFSSVEFRC